MNRRVQFLIVTSSTFLVIILLLGTVAGRTASADNENAYKHFRVYTEVLSRIKGEYVEEPDMKNVTLGALNGLLESLDPFASYLSPEQYKQWNAARQSKKADVGLLLSKKYGSLNVVSALPGSPAAKAGLSTGDLIENIKGVATRDMPLAYAEQMLQGDPGSQVEVTVMRIRRPEPHKLTLTRAFTKLPPVAHRYAGDGVGVVTIPSLETGKTAEVTRALNELVKLGAKKFIVDLRNNAVGTPEEGAALANLFLEKGLITYVQGQKSPKQEIQAQPEKALFKTQQLAVLTNRGTADGAEVAAAALLDNKRAEVIGDRSYGMASIRKPVPLDDGSAVLLSVAKYYSPAGKAIQDNSVVPGIQVAEIEPAPETDDAAPQAQPETRRNPDDDPVLKRALEHLTGRRAADAKEAAAPGAGAGNTRPGSDQPRPLTPLNIPRP